MRKLVFVFATLVAFSFAACGGQTVSTTSTDSAAVDSLDTIDTVEVVDSASVADTIIVK